MQERGDTPVAGEALQPQAAMGDLLALESFLCRVCAPLLAVPQEQLLSFLQRPTSTLKLKRFATDARLPVLFLTSVASAETEQGAYGNGTFAIGRCVVCNL